MPVESPHRRVTTLSWLFVAVAMFLIGMGLIAASSADVNSDHPFWKAFSGNIGGVLLATGLISLLWELISRRVFLSEVFSVARLSEDIKRSGLHRLTTNFQHDVEWPELLGSAKRIDVFVSYARTWRNNNLSLLRAFAGRSGNQMNLILPDPDNADVMRELARRYSTTPQTVQDRVNETINAFAGMFDKRQGGKGQLSIWVTEVTPVFTFYRIDKKYVIAAYRHRPDRGDIPTLVCDRRGELTDFIDREYEYFTSESTQGVKKIFPPPKNVPVEGCLESELVQDRKTDQTQSHIST